MAKSKFGRIVITKIQEDGSYLPVDAEFEGNTKQDAETYLRNANLESDSSSKYAILRVYDEVYTFAKSVETIMHVSNRDDVDSEFESAAE